MVTLVQDGEWVMDFEDGVAIWPIVVAQGGSGFHPCPGTFPLQITESSPIFQALPHLGTLVAILQDEVAWPDACTHMLPVWHRVRVVALK